MYKKYEMENEKNDKKQYVNVLYDFNHINGMYYKWFSFLPDI